MIWDSPLVYWEDGDGQLFATCLPVGCAAQAALLSLIIPRAGRQFADGPPRAGCDARMSLADGGINGINGVVGPRS